MNWNFEPSVILGIVLASFVYWLSAGPWRGRFPGSAPLTRGQSVCFPLAMLALVVALLSPIDVLADHSLLLMHMVQHLLLTLVMPPLLLLGLPGWMLRPLLRVPLLPDGGRPEPSAGFAKGIAVRAAVQQTGSLPLALLRRLTKPLPAFIAFNAVFAAWHAPALYEATLNSEGIHLLEHFMFMGTALLTWWPILSPLPELPRASYPLQVLYLFLESIIPTVLGGIITLAPDVLYPTYLHAPRVWDLSAAEDQQWGGLIMWIPGSLIYLTALTAVFFTWFEGQEKAGEIR
jgi:putative membrane protein